MGQYIRILQNHYEVVLTHLYFNRMWIIQEIGTKASANLLWGDCEIDWHIICTVVENLTAYHHLRKKFYIKTAEIKYAYRRFIEPEKTSRHANRFKFMYELHRARHLQVTDPRDRVYAFLGHYSLRHGSNKALQKLRADYTKTVEEVYIDVAARALQDNADPLVALAAVQHLDLRSAPNPADLQSASALPSWVPDWRTYQSHILSEPTSPHRAIDDTRARLKVDSDHKLLEIDGIEINTVVACSSVFQDKTFHIAEDRHSAGPMIEKLWREVCGLSGQINVNERCMNGESSVFALLQTLSNGCVAIWWSEQSKLSEADRVPYREVPASEWLAHGVAFLSNAVQDESLISSDIRQIATDTKKGPHAWSRATNGASNNRVFARTRKDMYVLGPAVMAAGDVICVMYGGKLPFVLRPWGSRYLLVGECYIHGLVRCEARQMLDAGEAVEKTFQIV